MLNTSCTIFTGRSPTRMACFVTILFITSQKVFPRTKKGPQTSSWSQVSHDRTRLTLTLHKKPFSHPKPPASAKLLPWQQPQFLRCKMYWKIKIVEITCPSIALPSYHCGAGQVSFRRIMTICVTPWLTSWPASNFLRLETRIFINRPRLWDLWDLFVLDIFLWKPRFPSGKKTPTFPSPIMEYPIVQVNSWWNTIVFLWRPALLNLSTGFCPEWHCKKTIMNHDTLCGYIHATISPREIFSWQIRFTTFFGLVYDQLDVTKIHQIPGKSPPKKNSAHNRRIGNSWLHGSSQRLNMPTLLWLVFGFTQA